MKDCISDVEHETEHNQVQRVLQKSKKENELKKLLKLFAETRVTNLLSSNGLERQHVTPDGNFFFNSIIHQTGAEISATELRTKLCSHLREYENHYIGFFSRSQTKE